MSQQQQRRIRLQLLKVYRRNLKLVHGLNVAEMNAKIKSSGDEIAVTLICPENKEDFLNYIFLRERISQKQITLGSTGLIITEKLAKELGVKVGDAVTVNNGDGAIKKLEISGITENYIFHYAYISQEYYSQIFRLPPKEQQRIGQAEPDNEGNRDPTGQ